MQAAHLDTPTSIIASARTDRESKPYDHAAISNVPASKHNRHGLRNNQRHAYSMADRQSPLRPSLGSHSPGSRTRSRDHTPSNAYRSRSRVRRPGMRHSNRHIPLLRTQSRGEEPKESTSSVWLPFPSRRKPSPGNQRCSFIYRIRIRERFHVLHLAIGAANTAAQSGPGPSGSGPDRKIESLVRRRPLNRGQQSDVRDQPDSQKLIPICQFFRFTYPLPLETRRVEAVKWKFTVELKGSLFDKKWDTTGRRESVKLRGLTAESAACSSHSPTLSCSA